MDQPPASPATARRTNSHFRQRGTPLPPAEARRQGDISQLAYLKMGGRDPAIAFLNNAHDTLGGRPLDIATASVRASSVFATPGTPSSSAWRSIWKSVTSAFQTATDLFEGIARQIACRHDPLQLVEIRLAQTFDFRFAELAEHQVHFADAAMPAAEQDAPTARIEVGTAFHQSSHLGILPILAPL